MEITCGLAPVGVTIIGHLGTVKLEAGIHPLTSKFLAHVLPTVRLQFSINNHSLNSYVAELHVKKSAAPKSLHNYDGG